MIALRFSFLLLALTALGQIPVPAADKELTSFAPTVEKVLPSVVSVSTSRTLRLPPALRRFFGTDPYEKVQGLGSGVIVSADGYILTNNHVIENADEIIVSAGANKKEYKAKKIGADAGSDLAVLKVEDTGLPAVVFADSDQIRVGDVVLAVGTPFGLAQTVTMGIISGLGRGGMGIVDYENFIQTDASINPGNSGGALVDTSGRLVGINTAIFSRSGGNMGIGFAVPSNLAQQVLRSIREKGRVVRGYLGALVQPLTDNLAKALKVPQTTGALVAEISPGSPAEKAGLRNGDVITAVDAKPIPDPRQLRLVIGGMAPGTKTTLKYIRDGQEKSAQVELGELPAKESKIRRSSEDERSATGEGAEILDGITVTDLDESSRRSIGADAKLQGALIVDINEDSAAYKAGLREGQVIQEINREPVRNAADAMRLSQQAANQERVLLRVWSDNKSLYVPVERQ